MQKTNSKPTPVVAQSTDKNVISKDHKFLKQDLAFSAKLGAKQAMRSAANLNAGSSLKQSGGDVTNSTEENKQVVAGKSV